MIYRGIYRYIKEYINILRYIMLILPKYPWPSANFRRKNNANLDSFVMLQQENLTSKFWVILKPYVSWLLTTFVAWESAGDYVDIKREVIQMKRKQIDFLKRELQSLQKDENSQMADYVKIGGNTAFKTTIRASINLALQLIWEKRDTQVKHAIIKI